MSQEQRPHVVRLGVRYEAKALIAGLGAGAYSMARQRAEEASNDDIAKDWRHVASLIARETPNSAWAASLGSGWPFT